MKSTQVIIDVPRLISSKNFEKKIAKIINNALYDYNYYTASTIIVENAGMELAISYNSYNEFVSLKIDNMDNVIHIDLYSIDSEDYDFFKYPDKVNEITYSNRLKRLIYEVILLNKQTIKDEYQLYMENFNL